MTPCRKKTIKLYRKVKIDLDLARWSITFIGFDGTRPVIEIEERPAPISFSDIDIPPLNVETKPQKSLKRRGGT